MSKVAIQGNASGTGVFTLAAPNSNTNRTLDLPDASGTLDRLNRAGNVLQVVQTVYDTPTSVSTTEGSFVDLFSAVITPTSANSKILIHAMLSITTASVDGSFCALRRNSTLIGLGASGGSRTRATSGTADVATNFNIMNVNLMYLDSPATTSATTYYAVANRRNGSTLYINRSADDTDVASRIRAISTLTLMEIAG